MKKLSMADVSQPGSGLKALWYMYLETIFQDMFIP
jgi:hypothetical protein